jgi:hypothetical protein
VYKVLRSKFFTVFPRQSLDAFFIWDAPVSKDAVCTGANIYMDIVYIYFSGNTDLK